MESVLDTLYSDAVCRRNYRETAVEQRLYRKINRQNKRFQRDLMCVLSQYEQQGFAMGLRCGLALSEELFAVENLYNARRFGIMDANER